MNQRPGWTLAEAAKQFGVHVRTLRKAVDAGTIRSVRISPRVVLIPKCELTRLLGPQEGDK